ETLATAGSHDNVVIAHAHLFDRRSEMKERVRMATDPLHGIARRRRLRLMRIMHGAPAPCLAHCTIAVGEPGTADAGELVDARYGDAPDQHAQLGAADLQRLCGIVHR